MGRRRGLDEAAGARLVRLAVQNGTMIDAAELTPANEWFGMLVATLVCVDGRWRSHPWWSDATSLRGLMPVGLDQSRLIVGSSPMVVRRFGVLRRQRIVRWYWTLVSVDEASATFWGPFVSIDAAVRNRLPLTGA